MKKFKFDELCERILNGESSVLSMLLPLFESKTYNRVPGTTNSYRQDSANTNSLTDKHSHVYAKLDGRGAELYAVTVAGRGHDGSHGIHIPATHAEFFRSGGYKIPANNIIECLDVAASSGLKGELIILEG
jgi:hypothetical protein